MQAKEIEFQNHQKYTKNLLRISNEAAKSSEKEVNKAFDEVIAAFEARRAQLLAEVHSINESEVKQITAESESLACSLSRLSGSIQFTKQLLDNGDDVEVVAVSDQTVQTLCSLTKMTWDTSTLKPSLLRPKFESVKETINTFGKVISVVEPSDIVFSKMPMEALAGKESNCEVHLSEEISRRGYEVALEATIFHSDASVLMPTMVEKKDFNLWTVSFTPDKPGEHTVKVEISTTSLSQTFTVKQIDVNKVPYHYIQCVGETKSRPQTAYSYTYPRELELKTEEPPHECSPGLITVTDIFSDQCRDESCPPTAHVLRYNDSAKSLSVYSKKKKSKKCIKAASKVESSM